MATSNLPFARGSVRVSFAVLLSLAVLEVTAHGAPDVPPPDSASQAMKGVKPPADGGFFGQISPGSRKEPIVIQANQLEFNYERNRVVYRGKVHVTQGDLIIDSATLTVNYSRADDQKQTKLDEVVAAGDVVITQGARWATGGKAVFDQAGSTIVLSENPVLHDGPNEVTGDRLVVYLNEGRSIVESSAQKRVSAILYPGSGNAADGLAKPAAPGAERPAGGPSAGATETATKAGSAPP